MTDAGFTIPGDALLPPRRMADGSGARLAEQVSVEADRVSGALKDGVEAAKAASSTYGSMFTGGYMRMVQACLRSGAEIGDHILALMRARTPVEVFALNGAFVRRQAASMPSRALELMGMGR